MQFIAAMEIDTPREHRTVVNPPGRISLRLKLTLLAVLVSALPIALVGLVLIDINQDALKQTLREHFYSVIDDITQDIETAFVQAQDDLDGVARVLASSALAADTRIELARALVAANEGISAVAVYDQDARLIDVFSEVTGHPTAMPEALDSDLIAAARADGRSIGRVELFGDAPRVPLIVPIQGQQATWFALSYVSLDPLQDRIESFVERGLHDMQHTVFVIDDQLRAIAHSDPEVANRLVSMSDTPLLRDLDPAALTRGLLVFRDLDDPAGQPVVAAVGSLTTIPWAVTVQLPRDVAYASFSRMRTWVIAVVCVMIFLATIAAVFLSRRITAPIKLLVKFAHDLARRRFERRVEVNTRDELSILGLALSDAACQLEASDDRIRNEIAIRSDLGRYLPGKLVDQIVERKQTLALGGERRSVTVLFADVAGFTPLVEKHSADEVVTILNELFTILTEIIFRHGGTVDKFIGDCVMAFWGAPDHQADHAARALAAAEDMLRWLEVGNAGWQERYGVTINLAIGVNTGEAVVGNFGSESRMEYTAVGDVVNVASRLETIARPQQILISAATRSAAGDEFDYLSIGERTLAGKTNAVELYEVRV